jgi:translation initiation factor IF-2
VQRFNIIVKADVQGSLTSVINSLKALDTNEVAIQVVSTGIGAITENDIHLAQTSQAVIYGFNVTMPSNIRQAASRDKVNVRLYNVIYELIDDVRSEMSDRLLPQIVETDLGRLVVRAIFKTTKTEVICGGEVTKGVLRVPAFARVMRDNEQLAEVEVTMLKRGPQETKEVNEGEMCGLSFKTDHKIEVQEGDRLELFQRETVERKL